MLTLHSRELRDTQSEGERDREREISLGQQPWQSAEDQSRGRAVISALLFRQESPFPPGSHKNRLTAAVHTKDLMALN